jgi:hypothetical protein
MNPLYKYSLIVSCAGLALQLLWIVYWFGVFNGGFKEFKEHVLESLKRLEGVFFKDVRVFQREPYQRDDSEALASSEAAPKRRR